MMEAASVCDNKVAFVSLFDAAKISKQKTQLDETIISNNSFLQTINWAWKRFIGILRQGVEVLQRPSMCSLYFLVILGILTSCTSLMVDRAVSSLIDLRHWITTADSGSMLHFVSSIPVLFYPLSFLLWNMLAVAFALSAALLIHYAPNAAGSGIPEMKCILSGATTLNSCLSFWTLVAKVVGLILVVGGAGLSVGLEGPFIHIAGCIAAQMLRVPIFKSLNSNYALRLHMLSFACCAGIAATFGAPFGGVLFSVEATSTFYLVSNLWKGAICAAVGSLCFYIFREVGIYGEPATTLHLFATDLDNVPITPTLYVHLAILAVLCGLFGALFVQLVKTCQQLRTKITRMKRSYLILLVTAVALITATTSYFMGSYLNHYPNETIKYLFSNDTLDKNHSSMVHLFFFCIIKFMLVVMAVSLPIPFGLLIPSITIGAAIGRFYSESINRIATSLLLSPGGFAVIGSSCFTIGVTRKVSTIVMIFELTGQLSYMMPVIITGVITLAVSDVFNYGIYDEFIQLKKLPYLKPPTNTTSFTSYSQESHGQCNDALALKQELEDGNMISTKLLQHHDIHGDHHAIGSLVALPLVDCNKELVEQVIDRIKTSRAEGKLDEERYVYVPIVKDSSDMTLIGEVNTEYLMQVIESANGRTQIGVDTRSSSSAAIPLRSSEPPMREELEQKELEDVPNEQTQLTISLSSAMHHATVTNGNDDSRPTSPTASLHASAAAVYRGDDEDDCIHVNFDPSPITVPVDTPISKLRLMFSMMAISHVYVLNEGKLAGVITKTELMNNH